MSRWWRAYDEAIDDPKLQLLPPPLFKAWFNLLCLASANDGVLPKIETISFKLRMPEAKIGALLEELIARGLLDEFDGVLRPHNWNGRQFRSDVSTERVKQFRERQRNVSCNDLETPPEKTDTERTESETERKKERSLRSRSIDEAPKAKKRTRGSGTSAKSPLPENFHPTGDFLSAEEEMDLERFKDHARQNDRRCADWFAAWRNWRRSPFQNQGKSNGAVELSPEKSVVAAAREMRSKLGSRADPNTVFRLPQERLRGPEEFCGTARDESGAVSDGSGGICDQSDDWHSNTDQVATFARRGR
jgi:hypothetical protein